MKSPNESKKFAGSSVAIAALGLSLLFSAPVWAQVTGATLSGTVTDASGAVIPNAQVSIKNTATGASTDVSTNADGLYTAPNLLPGSYDVTASASGFATRVQAGVVLTVGEQLQLNFTMQVGQATQKVEVTGAAPVVELASSTVGGVVASNTVVELPLNGRDWTQLATLHPSVNVVPTQTAIGSNSPRAARGFGNEMSISGTRPQLNNYRLDGISLTDYSGAGPGSVAGITMGVDAIGEFSVLTSNYSAEYGKTSGGVVNAITRSGTNQLHGSAYWFLRDEGLDARQFFDATVPPFHRNQFGASAGAPIRKDKTFVFGDYEGFRQAQALTNVDKVPSEDARNGIIHNADGTTCTIGMVSQGCNLKNSAGTVGVDPLVAPYLGFYPLPTGGLLGAGNTGIFTLATNNITDENFGTVRVDHRFSDKDSMFGTWFYDKAQISQPEPMNNWVAASSSFREMITLGENHIFSSSLVNDFRAGYTRVHTVANTPIQTINPLATDTSLGAFPGRAAAAVAVPGLTNFVGGVGGLSPSNYAWNTWQFYDDAFLTKGVHSLKFGFAFERDQDNPFGLNRPNGSYSFGSLTGFLLNEPQQFDGAIASTYARKGLRQSIFGGYVQDDWRFRPNLTLNLGLRYEAVTVPTEIGDRIVNLVTLTTPSPGRLGNPYFNNPSLRDFEPRVGFSWDPTHNGKTAIRGAFGIFDALPLQFIMRHPSMQSYPYGVILTAGGTDLPAGSFPTGAVEHGAAAGASASQTAVIQDNPPRNYVMIWNLNVQQQLTPSTSITLGYVGNHGVHMVNRWDDANIVVPTATSAGYLWPFPAGSGTVINPTVGTVRFIEWGGTSLYDALVAQVSKRMSHGFQVQGSYTWGKILDTGSASLIGDPFTNSISSPLWWGCNSCRKGLADFNVAQTFVANYLWDLPTPRNWGTVGSHLLGGWELGGILTLETGVPVTPLIGGDPLGLNSGDAFAYPNRLAGCSTVNSGNVDNYINANCYALPMAAPAIAASCTPFPNASVAGTCQNLMGNSGRNTVVGPGIATFDFSVFKNNYIRKVSENFNLQFRAEFFNLFNRPNFGTPVDNSTMFDAKGNPVGNAGALDTLSTSARQIQLALKLIW
jgi:carboxypeptidase family protein/TonB-dependent receptor-like protein